MALEALFIARAVLPQNLSRYRRFPFVFWQAKREERGNHAKSSPFSAEWQERRIAFHAPPRRRSREQQPIRRPAVCRHCCQPRY